MNYRREIDGLRALAVVPVILFHAGSGWFRGGYAGVDVFFVISGYLITAIILSELERGTFSVADFYERRARRILPALGVVLPACLPFAWLWLLPGDMKDFSQSLVAVSLFASNVLFWRESGYFDTVAEFKPLLHTWSLAVEEQFYLLFPLLLILFWRFGRRPLLLALSAVFLASLALAQWGAYAKPAAAFFLLPTRAWELLLGAFAAFYLSKAERPQCSRGAAELGAWLGLALILYAVFAFDEAARFPGVSALVPTVGALLVILFSTQETMAGRLVGRRVFAGIGLISYSAYLWHLPLFAFLKHSGFAESRRAYLLLVCLTFVLAYLTWRFVEQPFRQKRRFRRPTIFALAALMLAGLALLGVSGYRSNGFEDRTGMLAFSDLKYDMSAFGYAPCDNVLTRQEPRLNFCYGSGRPPTALLVGDSHADDKFVGIERALGAYDWGMAGNASCPPLYGVRMKSSDGTDCTVRLQKLFAYIAAQPSLELVVLSFAHMYPLDRYIAADHLRRRFRPEDTLIEDASAPQLKKADAFYAGLERTIAFLEARQLRTVLLLDTPELAFFPADCLKGKIACSFSKDAVLARQRLLRTQAARLQARHPGLQVFDPLGLFCGASACQALQGGRAMYRDSHHLSHFGSLQYGRALAGFLQPAS